MIVREIHPNHGDPIALNSPDVRDRLAALYEISESEWVRINLVASVSGSIVGSDSTSETLTNRADRKILGVIRRQSDVVLVGAETVRAEGYQLPRTARLAIVTGSGNFDGHDFDIRNDRMPPLVLCPHAVADRAQGAIPDAEIVVVPDAGGRMTAERIIGVLRDRGLAKITCEAPSLGAQLLDGGLVTELCLSTSPIAGGPLIPTFGFREIAAHKLRLARLLIDESHMLYARWSVSS